MSLTDCADNASVARHGRFRVDVQQAHVLDKGVRHGSMKLLGVDDGRTHILWLRHDWICVRRKGPVETERETRVTTDQTTQPLRFIICYVENGWATD